MDRNTYRKLYLETKVFYYKIGVVLCPDLNGEKITFGPAGWKHIVIKDGIPRRFEDRLRRFSLIKYAEQVIREGKIVYYREDIKNNILGKFWRLRHKINNMDLKVIIRQVGNGNLHFFSIMN